jgi:hypothetical protein
MFARKYVTAAAFSLLLAITACSVLGEPAGLQSNGGASGKPESTPEPIREEIVEPDPIINPPDLGPAPDIKNDVWLNTDIPLDLEAVRGRVVLIEFWTFG